MCPKGRGCGLTPPRVTAFLTEAVAKSSQAAVARESGITRLNLQRYLKGIGEPTTATLQKLADYFGLSVAYLRGEGTLADVIKPKLPAIKASIVTEAIVNNDPNILINKSKAIGYDLSETQALKIMAESKSMLDRWASNASELDFELFNAIENDISEHLLLDAIMFGLSYLVTLSKIIKMSSKSPSIRSISEALLTLDEKGREQALEILQREGIIPPSTDQAK